MGAVPFRATTTSTEARIGEVLKRLREQHGLSLRTLAARAGFSASFLSQLEHGQVSPSIASLEKIAAELGVTLAGLFDASSTPIASVVRAGARSGFTSSWSGARIESLTPAGERGRLEAIAVTLASGGASGKDAVGHPADQFAYVLSGPLALSLADERLLLHGGDAVMIPRGTPHRWQNTSVEAAQVILVSVRIAH